MLAMISKCGIQFVRIANELSVGDFTMFIKSSHIFKTAIVVGLLVGCGGTDDNPVTPPSSTCAVDADCTVVNGAAICVEGVCELTCAPGYTGSVCQEDVDECADDSHGCDPNSDCVNEEGSHFCLCHEGFISVGAECVEAPSAASVETTVDVVSVAAGETVTVTCNALDENGDSLAIPEGLSVDAGEGTSTEINPEGTFQVTLTMAGDIAITCALGELKDTSPETVTVTPGPAHSWSVDTLEGNCLKPGSAYNVQVAVTDAWDNPVDANSIDVSTVPAGGLVAGTEPNSYTVGNDGDYDVSVTWTGPTTDNATIQAYTATLLVDGTPPTIVLISPERADMLKGGTVAETSVNMDGSVSDVTSGLAEVVLNGETIPHDDAAMSVAIDTTQASVWGMNIVEGHATDVCGNSATLVQSYLRSPYYAAAATNPDPNAVVSSGLIALLTQVIIDDFDSSDVDDLATIAQMILADWDFNDLIPPDQELANKKLKSCSGVVGGSTGYTVVRDPNKNITWSAPKITSLTAKNGSIKLMATIKNAAVPVKATAKIMACVLGIPKITTHTLAGNVTVNTATLTMSLSPKQTNGLVTFNADNTSVTASSVNVDVDCWSAVQFVCDKISSSVSPYVQDSVTDGFKEAAESAVPGMLTDFVQGFGGATQVDAPAPVELSIQVHQTMADIQCKGGSDGHMQLQLDAQAYPEQKNVNIPATARGAIQKESGQPPFDATAYSLAMALDDNLLNQMLWSLWYGGGLNIQNLSAFVPSEYGVQSLIVEALAPPVMMPIENSDNIRVGFGDLLMHVIANPSGAMVITQSFYASGTIEGTIDLDPLSNKLEFVTLGDPEFRVQLLEGDLTQDQDTLITIVLGQVAPVLLDAMISSIQLPSFDLSSVAGLPAGTVWSLTNGGVERTQHHFVFSGSIGTK